MHMRVTECGVCSTARRSPGMAGSASTSRRGSAVAGIDPNNSVTFCLVRSTSMSPAITMKARFGP